MPRAVTAGLALSLTLVLQVPAQQAPTAAGAIIVAEYDGIIHPVAAEFLDEALRQADAADASLVVLILRTPGGLLESTRTMVSSMIASRMPVVVFVAPPGGRAASAGFILTIAADVAAMAPGTHIGAAHPVGASGQDEGGETMRDKVASDTAAYARTLATSRGRNVELAGQAVTESRAFTEQEALTAKPPLIDLVAADLPALLAALDGRRITRFDGREVTLSTKGRVVRHVEMTRRQRLLSAIAHPQVALLLFSLGSLGLIIELWNPGFIAPGVVGGICLLLSFFAFQVLPVNVVGILLLVLGVALLIIEVKVPSFGVLGIGGIFALLAGSTMITREVPGVRVNYGLLVPVTLTLAGMALGLGRLAMRAQQQRTVTGAEAMTGERGESLTRLAPDTTGQVRVHGEIWRAVSPIAVPAGVPVRVTAVEGLTVRVEPITEIPEGEPT